MSYVATYTGEGAFPYDPMRDPRRPQYVSANWDALIPAARNRTDTVRKSGTLAETVQQMHVLVRDYGRQMCKVANVLKTGDPEQDAYHVWHWIKTHVRFKLDKTGVEQLRTPARSWADRRTGVDCDCYSIMAASLLKCMGYRPTFVVVKFSGQDSYTHVFVVCNGYTVDVNMSQFNEEPDLINERMQIDVLSGVATQTKGLSGCGCSGKSTMGAVSGGCRCGGSCGKCSGDKRLKVWLEHAKGECSSREYQLAKRLAPVVTIDAADELVPYGNLSWDDVKKYLAIQIVGLEHSQFRKFANEVYKQACLERAGNAGLAGFGDWIRNAWNKVTDPFKKLFSGKLGDLFKKAWEFIKKVNPVSVVARNSYLALIALNFRGFADYFAGCENAFKTVIATWKKLGGNPDKLKGAIAKGKGKLALLGRKDRRCPGKPYCPPGYQLMRAWDDGRVQCDKICPDGFYIPHLDRCEPALTDNDATKLLSQLPPMFAYWIAYWAVNYSEDYYNWQRPGDTEAGWFISFSRAVRKFFESAIANDATIWAIVERRSTLNPFAQLVELSKQINPAFNAADGGPSVAAAVSQIINEWRSFFEQNPVFQKSGPFGAFARNTFFSSLNKELTYQCVQLLEGSDFLLDLGNRNPSPTQQAQETYDYLKANLSNWSNKFLTDLNTYSQKFADPSAFQTSNGKVYPRFFNSGAPAPFTYSAMMAPYDGNLNVGLSGQLGEIATATAVTAVATAAASVIGVVAAALKKMGIGEEPEDVKPGELEKISGQVGEWADNVKDWLEPDADGNYPLPDGSSGPMIGPGGQNPQTPGSPNYQGGKNNNTTLLLLAAIGGGLLLFSGKK